MNMPLLRPATLDDIPAITTIYADAVRHDTATFEIDPPDEAEMAQRWRTLMAGQFPYLVACDADPTSKAILGYAYAGPYRLRPAYRFTVENSIYLAASARHRGLGTQLLTALIATCEAQGFRQMIAVIGDSANQASIHLHRRLGFAPVGTFSAVGFKFGRWLDAVLMQRALGPGSATDPVERN